MIFGEVPVGEAEGTILAHSLRIASGRLKKGTRLAAADLEALAAAGFAAVTVARLEPGDVGENEAAARLAAAMVGPGVQLANPFTGRANLLALADGVALIDEARVHALNRVHESLTVATVRPFELVEAGHIVATVKVIPLSVPGDALGRATAIAAAGEPVIAHAPFRPADIGLLITEFAGDKPSLAEKAYAVTEARLTRLGSRIIAHARCRHEPGAVAAALGHLIAAGSTLVIVFSASAVVDRGDVVPAGIVAAGGRIVHFGMPVDPGNLQLVAAIGDVAVLAAPGSARSPRLHGFDWVLWRVLAGLEVGPEEITAMGVGGLLKEIAIRPQPRAAPAPTRPARARIVAVVLAAGRSRRMGARNKLLLDVGGIAMVRRVAEAAATSKAASTIVVTGHEEAAVRDALAGLDVRFVHNPDFAEGLSTSLAAGIAAVGADADGAVVVLGDMPGIGPAHIDRLIAAFDPGSGHEICVSTAGGKRGNPVLWGRRFFEELTSLKGDVGARHLIGENAESVVEVEQGAAAGLDVDTPEAYAALGERG